MYFSDNINLVYPKGMSMGSPREKRMAAFLMGFRLNFNHVSGKHEDSLSRGFEEMSSTELDNRVNFWTPITVRISWNNVVWEPKTHHSRWLAAITCHVFHCRWFACVVVYAHQIGWREQLLDRLIQEQQRSAKSRGLLAWQQFFDLSQLGCQWTEWKYLLCFDDDKRKVPRRTMFEWPWLHLQTTRK